MWERYRKTFVGMQVLIGGVTLGALLVFGLMPAVLFFVVMQLSSVIGAVWAARLSWVIQRRATALPLRPAL